MDRFQELSKIALDELSEVFARMSDENVRELLEEIKKADRIFLLGAGREGLSTREFAMRLMHLGKESHWVWDDTTPSMGPPINPAMLRTQAVITTREYHTDK